MQIREVKTSVKRLVSVVALSGAIVAGGWWAEASANSGGIYNQAEAGCTCHGPGLAAPTTRIFILGLPDGSDPTIPTGYVPEKQYDLQILVIGLSAPPLGAGFNLHPSAGTVNVPAGDLTNADDSAKVRHETECVRLEDYFLCTPGAPGNDCGVRPTQACPVFDASNSACARCSTVNADCRACNDVTVFDVQATHTQPKSFPFTWNLTWTAPPANTGPVTFHLAANVVNGDGQPSTQDLWNKLGGDPLQPVITVPEGEKPAILPLPLPAH